MIFPYPTTGIVLNDLFSYENSFPVMVDHKFGRHVYGSDWELWLDEVEEYIDENSSLGSQS
jgi:hypothetical protein